MNLQNIIMLSILMSIGEYFVYNLVYGYMPQFYSLSIVFWLWVITKIKDDIIDESDDESDDDDFDDVPDDDNHIIRLQQMIVNLNNQSVQTEEKLDQINNAVAHIQTTIDNIIVNLNNGSISNSLTDINIPRKDDVYYQI